jgi:hypothetical protein
MVPIAVIFRRDCDDKGQKECGYKGVHVHYETRSWSNKTVVPVFSLNIDDVTFYKAQL